MSKLRVSSGYARVNKHRPCRICGKPDWCSYTCDEQISICMRVRAGARRINRHGGAIFIHDDADLYAPTHIMPQAQQTPLAPKQVRDFVYRNLMLLSPALRFRSVLIDGVKGLRARGFAAEDWHRYGALPAGCAERDRLARTLFERVRARFPKHGSLRGVPGFWRDETGWHLWTLVDYRQPRLLIPCCNERGWIQACQMRSPGPAQQRLRYCWLSSKGQPEGTSSGSPLHFTYRQSDSSSTKPITIVEGLLKADALVALRQHQCVVATAGVTANHEALIELTKGKRAILAFDQDYFSNPTVCLGLATILARRAQSEGTLDSTQIACWPGEVKGIDDAAVQGLPINIINVERWLAGLPLNLREQVLDTWRAHAATPFPQL